MEKLKNRTKQSEAVTIWRKLIKIVLLKSHFSQIVVLKNH